MSPWYSWHIAESGVKHNQSIYDFQIVFLNSSNCLIFSFVFSFYDINYVVFLSCIRYPNIFKISLIYLLLTYPNTFGNCWKSSEKRVTLHGILLTSQWYVNKLWNWKYCDCYTIKKNSTRACAFWIELQNTVKSAYTCIWGKTVPSHNIQNTSVL